jgi:hypothetical protein
MKGKMDAYAGGTSNVDKEAKGAEPDEKETPQERKKGGKVDCRKRGGKIEGKMMKKRLDRPMRKAGGNVGADSVASTNPDFQSAGKVGRAPLKTGGKVGADRKPLTEANHASKPMNRALAEADMTP